MQFRYCFSLAVPLLALALTGAAGTAGAVELGEPQMRSHIGQPLSADIELTGLSSDTATIQAAVADAEVYRGASLAMHPALASANVTTFRREGRRYLHISAATPIRADHLPIFFNLTDNGQKSVRQVTLWLTPDPNPAPPPPPPALAVPAAPIAVAPVVAAPPAAAPPAPPATVMPAPLPRVAPLPRPIGLVAPADGGRHRLALPRAGSALCAPRAADAEADSCTALGASNAALSAHLVELEDKVKQLSVALQGSSGPAAPAAASPAAAAVAAAAAAAASTPKVAPAPKPLPPKLVPMGAKPPEASAAHGGAGKPWLVIGISAAIILSLVGGLAFLLLRQRGKARLKRAAAAPASDAATVRMPSFISSVKNRLTPRRAAAPVDAAEVANTVPAL